MKKEWFRRPFRMVHRFHEGEREDTPLGLSIFDPEVPISPNKLRSKPLSVQRHGEYRCLDPMSPIVSTKNGKVASMNGPSPDLADPIAQTIPASTVKRKIP